jgi:hypothetical protein
MFSKVLPQKIKSGAGLLVIIELLPETLILKDFKRGLLDFLLVPQCFALYFNYFYRI